MKNILLFTHSLSGGGTEKTVRQISKYLNEHPELGFQSYLCVVNDDEKCREQLGNVIVLKNRSNPDDRKFQKAVNVLRQIREIKQLKRENKIVSCISFLPGADIINVFSKTGEKVILSVRSRESLWTYSILKKWYIKIAYHRCDLITAVTDVVRRDCIDFFGADKDKVRTIYNASYPIRTGGSLDKEFSDFIKGRKVFIHVGRLKKVKCQDMLIRAFASVLKEHEDTCLVIIGGGEIQEELQQEIDELGIAESVLLTGEKLDPGAYMGKSDYFVLSSHVEGMPNVILEAMQCGLPVISTDCGAREILAPESDPLYRTSQIEKAEYGILVPTDEQEMLSNAMEMFVADPQLASSYAARNVGCLERFSVEHIMEQWCDVLTP